MCVKTLPQSFLEWMFQQVGQYKDQRKNSKTITDISDCAGLSYHLNIKVHKVTLTKRLKNIAFFVRVARTKPVLSKMDRPAKLRSAKLHLAKPKGFWNNFL